MIGFVGNACADGYNVTVTESFARKFLVPTIQKRIADCQDEINNSRNCDSINLSTIIKFRMLQLQYVLLNYKSKFEHDKNEEECRVATNYIISAFLKPLNEIAAQCAKLPTEEDQKNINIYAVQLMQTLLSLAKKPKSVQSTAAPEAKITHNFKSLNEKLEQERPSLTQIETEKELDDIHTVLWGIHTSPYLSPQDLFAQNMSPSQKQKLTSLHEELKTNSVGLIRSIEAERNENQKKREALEIQA